MTHEESARMLRSASRVPIYGIWDLYMSYGVVGGMMTRGKELGELAANLALSILRGKAASDIPVIKEIVNYCMFDMMELRRFHISLKELPPDSIIINQAFQPLVDLRGKT